MSTYQINLNEKGSRTLEVTPENLAAIRKYNLFDGLLDSTGYVTEDVLQKLRLNIRSLIAHSTDDVTDLLDLCIDVVYHDHMKAYGLSRLVELYESAE